MNGEISAYEGLGFLSEAVSDELSRAGWQSESVLLREKKIAGCTGCFGCWTKTPGKCVINDFGRELAAKVCRSDLIVYVTDITFGGYSSELKKAIDRFSCPMLLPFFTKIRGEVHHKPRYTPLPSLLGLGVLPTVDMEEERLFRTLVERNAVNLHSAAVQSGVFYRSQDSAEIGDKVRSLIAKVRSSC